MSLTIVGARFLNRLFAYSWSCKYWASFSLVDLSALSLPSSEINSDIVIRYNDSHIWLIWSVIKYPVTEKCFVCSFGSTPGFLPQVSKHRFLLSFQYIQNVQLFMPMRHIASMILFNVCDLNWDHRRHCFDQWSSIKHVKLWDAHLADSKLAFNYQGFFLTNMWINILIKIEHSWFCMLGIWCKKVESQN